MQTAYAAALGTFDGVHIGHREVLNQALQSGLCPIAVSFRLPPKSQMGQNIPLLMSPEEKEQLLRQMGFVEQMYLDFDAVRHLSPKAFLDMLFAAYPLQAICCGFNYRFGKNGAGDVAFLKAYCAEKGAKVLVCDGVQVQGQTVSSTQIRALIAEGEMQKAAAMLGRNYSISGPVVHGDARGRTIGFPTVNQAINPLLAMPKFGVYAARCQIGGQTYAAVTNVGLRPTFRLDQPMAETYICDFEGDLYDQNLTVELIKFLRPEKRFADLEELQAAIAADAAAAKAE